MMYFYRIYVFLSNRIVSNDGHNPKIESHHLSKNDTRGWLSTFGQHASNTDQPSSGIFKHITHLQCDPIWII